MPYVKRSSIGRIVALYALAQADAQEFLPSTHPDVQVFLGIDNEAAFAALDYGFIRVVEDLIDTLINKGVLCVTDLPAQAQQKILSRKGMRQHMLDPVDFDTTDDVI